MPKSREARGFAEMSATPIQLLVPTGAWIEGSVYLSEEPARFSDAWEQIVRDARAYIAVRDAEARYADGSLGEKEPFLLVRKDSIVAIKPVENE